MEDLCLGIRPGERFGFLGSNGAGKTTTLSIVAGQQRATSGAAFVAGAPAGSDIARAALGYCPQVCHFIGGLRRCSSKHVKGLALDDAWTG